MSLKARHHAACPLATRRSPRCGFSSQATSRRYSGYRLGAVVLAATTDAAAVVGVYSQVAGEGNARFLRIAANAVRRDDGFQFSLTKRYSQPPAPALAYRRLTIKGRPDADKRALIAKTHGGAITVSLLVPGIETQGNNFREAFFTLNKDETNMLQPAVDNCNPGLFPFDKYI